MPIDFLPIWVFFLVSAGLVVVSVDIGFRLGRNVRSRSEDERESPASSIAGVILGLQAFMLAFTFSIVSDRFDTRKALAREEANVLRVAWQRSHFLTEPHRGKTTALLADYVEKRIDVAHSQNLERARGSLQGFRDTHRQLWEIAVENGRIDMNSDIGALYVESINEIGSIHALRIALGFDARVPTAIWAALLTLLMLGMIALGYYCALADSRRSRVIPVLAVSFALVIALIAALDQPGNSLMPVPQQPLENVLSEIRE